MNKKRLLSLLLCAIPILVSAETIGVFYDQNVPQYAFAASDIKNALESQGVDVKIYDITSLRKSYKKEKIVISASTDTKSLSFMAKQGGSDIPALGSQAYAIRVSDSPRSCWVFGGDVNGAMYGGLQVAEIITFDGFKSLRDAEESPFVKSRGIKFNIPFDKDSPTYFYANHGTANMLAIKDVWDIQFWKTWFDEMARHRYNALSLWSPHPFTSMLDMEDEYPGIAIQGVTGFDEKGKEIRVNEMTIGEKIDFWKEVMKYGKDRGFDIYILTWNIFLSTAEGKHGLTSYNRNEKTKEYLRKCTTKMLETYPDLKGIGLTVGENMGDLDKVELEEWAWATYGQGMMDYAQVHPERELEFIHRQHFGNVDHIVAAFAKLDALPNVKFELSCKYSEAHAHSTTTPARWETAGMEAGLDKYGMKSWLTVRNDDFHFLHWSEPQFVREYVKGFPAEKYLSGFYIGPDGWVHGKDFTSIDSYYRDKGALSIQRTWYMQKIWGRISYNPEISDDFFKKCLANRFPGVPADKLFEAWSDASGAVRRANEQVTGKWKYDFHFWIEAWTGKSKLVNDDCHYSIQDTKEATPAAGSRIASLRETAKDECAGKIPAWENIESIEKMALRSLDILKSLRADNDKELELTLKDIEAQAYLALYSAFKYRTVIYDIQGRGNVASEAMDKACDYWLKYTEIMGSLYYPAKMQRNRDFSSWHEYDEVVRNEYSSK